MYRLEIKDAARARLRSVSSEPPTVQQLAAELRQLRERVEDLEDLRDLTEAIDRNAVKPGASWEDLCHEFGWDFEKEKERLDSDQDCGNAKRKDAG